MVDYISIARSESNKHNFDFPTSFTRWAPELNRHEINVLKLLNVNTPVRFGQLLEKNVGDLQTLINQPTYISFKIPKKKGGTRTISAPDGQLKLVQKKLNYYLQAYYLCIKPNESHGFVIHPKSMQLRCNIVENARIHSQKKYVLNIDLKDFFPCITSIQVKELFISLLFDFTEHMATALALLTTFEGKLPIGAPTSPVISNFICMQLDADLIDFAAKNQLAYSRYADDLTFSSNSKIEQETIIGIRHLIEQNKFKVNEKKFRLQTSNRKQTVTGITVNEKINVDRKLLKKVRAMLHEWTTKGLLKAAVGHFQYSIGESDIYRIQDKFKNRLKGYINFIGQVRGKNDFIYKRFKSEFLVNEKL